MAGLIAHCEADRAFVMRELAAGRKPVRHYLTVARSIADRFAERHLPSMLAKPEGRWIGCTAGVHGMFYDKDNREDPWTFQNDYSAASSPELITVCSGVDLQDATFFAPSWETGTGCLITGFYTDSYLNTPNVPEFMLCVQLPPYMLTCADPRQRGVPYIYGARVLFNAHWQHVADHFRANS